MAARRGRRDRVAPPPTGGPGPDPGGGVRGGSWASRSQAPYGTGGSVSAAEQVHEEGNDSSFVSLSRLGPSLREKDLEMEELILQDETLLETMQSYMDASLISLIEDFGEQSRLSLEDQNEMSLLTALTEILDNADSENLSPFDTIPDSELLVSPRESSSLHKLLNLSRTPPERDLITPIDPLGPSTGSSRVSGVEVPLADSPWDFSPPPFLETSSPKLPSWRPSRPRPRWGQSPPPQQRSDGEEEEEVAGFSGQMLAGKLDNSVNNVLDFPMHLACPEEEGTAEGADAPASAPGDESISSLSELVRAMHPYCLPNLTHLASLEGELEGQADADADELTLPEGCVVLEIVGQAATTGDDLEIPVVVRQIPSGSQSVLLDESLGSSPALQLLMPTMESETEAAVPEVAPCPDEELPLSSACLLEPREIMESLTPKEPQSLPASASQGSQKVPRKGRKKKNKEQPTACVEACTRRLRSSSRGQSTVSAEVNSQAGSSQKQPQEELQREAAALQSRGKPRAWARAWAAALEKTGSENLERSAGQDSPAEEDALDLCPKLLETSQANPTLSLNDSAQADSMPVDSVEGDSPAVGNAAPGDQASSGTELVGSLPVGPNLTSPVLADKKGIEPAVAIPTSDNLSPADVLANTVAADPVPNDPAPADPVLVKCRPTAAAAAAYPACWNAMLPSGSGRSFNQDRCCSPDWCLLVQSI